MRLTFILPCQSYVPILRLSDLNSNGLSSSRARQQQPTVIVLVQLAELMVLRLRGLGGGALRREQLPI